MYTNQQWIDMLTEVDSLAYRYEKLEEKKHRYWELKEKKEDIKDNTGGFVALVLIVVIIFVFVKFGWLRGIIVLVVGLVLYGTYDEHIVEKKVKRKLQDFEEKYGEEMKKLEIENEDIVKQQRDMETNESYTVCKSNLPSEYMGSSWYGSYRTNKRLAIRMALKDGAETLEKAIELEQKSNS